ncbi:MAG: leukotriene A4 hydrolase C-terminal domain-containing protein [Lewinellaceae bacterium]|nr:leukotriene A4 hydrolase C-terminal domain-containing protein [Lewinellaceae bacterium]
MNALFSISKERIFFWFAILLIALPACTVEGNSASSGGNSLKHLPKMLDPHSVANVDEVRITHSDFNLRLNLNRLLLEGQVIHTLQFLTDKPKHLILDMAGQEIEQVSIIKENGEVLPADYAVNQFSDEQQGEASGSISSQKRGLVISLEKGARKVSIKFHLEFTHGQEASIVFLAPHQTRGGRHPMFLTFNEPIGARSIFPCQDTPMNQFTYSAEIQVPAGLIALMSSEDNPRKKSNNGSYSFNMEKPIPTYLWSLMIGDFKYIPTGQRTGIYAEEENLEAASKEFSEFEKMIQAGEKVFGPYQWTRQDLIILPAVSFSFSAMENPCLFVASDYMITGDRSLNFINAHELAHGFFTNIIPNRTWIDLPVANEGFTEYLRYLILMEAYGEASAQQQAYIDYMEAIELVKEAFPETPIYQRAVAHPGETLNPIAYHKGFLFWLKVEKDIGRDRIVEVVRQHTENGHRTSSISTEGLLSAVYGRDVTVDEFEPWLLARGYIPEDLAMICPGNLNEVTIWLEEALKEMKVDFSPGSWNFYEWKYLFYTLLRDGEVTNEQKLALLRSLRPYLNNSNAILHSLFLQNLVRAGAVEEVSDELKAFLPKYSTLRLVRPLYAELSQTDIGMAIAQQAFAIGRRTYSSATKSEIKKVLKIN